MKKFLYLSVVAMLALLSCKLTKYDRFPGSKLAVFPEKIIGEYVLKEHKGSSASDTNNLRITSNMIQISDPNLKTFITLNDSNVFTVYKDFYFLSTRIPNTKTAEWFVYPIKIKKKKILVYTISSGKIQKKLDKYLSLKPASFNDYIMNDDRFYKFCKRKLKRRHSFVLVKAKS